MNRISAIAIVTALVLPRTVPAAIIYSTPGDTYSQNFNSLPNTPQNVSLGNTPTGWKDDDAAPPAGNFSIPGWYLHHPLVQAEGGFNGNQRMRIGAGTANTGAFMSFGASGSTERALGMLSSNTMAAAGADSYYGARFTNSTGRRLVSFDLSYTGEQWRDGGAATPNAQSILFEYSLNATSVQDALATWNSVSALDFTSPTFVNTGGGAATDGNAAANRMAKSVTNQDLLLLGWLPATDMWIRWKDVNNAGNDHGLAVDDLSFSADIPEPASLMLLLLGAIGAVAARRLR